MPNATTKIDLPDVSALAADVAAIRDEAEDPWMALAKVCQRAQAASDAFAALGIEDPDGALKRRAGLTGLQDTLRDIDHRLCMALEDTDRVLEPEVYQR